MTSTRAQTSEPAWAVLPPSSSTLYSLSLWTNLMSLNIPSSPTDTVEEATHDAISAKLTFPVRHLIHSLASLTTLCRYPPSPENFAYTEIKAMVKELETKHGVQGYRRMKSWLAWHVETVRLVYEGFPDVDKGSEMAGWLWVMTQGEGVGDMGWAMWDILLGN
ncbi:hypothetical protein G6514_009307 [Epicoccum nigrum]|nr:hypothetical protein G6514_009307 [Epicoccum nigrum]